MNREIGERTKVQEKKDKAYGVVKEKLKNAEERLKAKKAGLKSKRENYQKKKDQVKKESESLVDLEKELRKKKEVYDSKLEEFT